jgi:hypothetical protein
MPKAIAIEEVEKMLNAVRTHPDLNHFRDKKGKEFCEKHGITGGQLNFLVAVIAAERIKKGNEEAKQRIIDKRNDKLSR